MSELIAIAKRTGESVILRPIYNRNGKLIYYVMEHATFNLICDTDVEDIVEIIGELNT